MNKIIIGVVMISLAVVGIFSYFYLDQEELPIYEENFELKNEPIDEGPVEVAPTRTIKLDYANLGADCKITKCTVDGCSC